MTDDLDKLDRLAAEKVMGFIELTNPNWKLKFWKHPESTGEGWEYKQDIEI